MAALDTMSKAPIPSTDSRVVPASRSVNPWTMWPRTLNLLASGVRTGMVQSLAPLLGPNVVRWFVQPTVGRNHRRRCLEHLLLASGERSFFHADRLHIFGWNLGSGKTLAHSVCRCVQQRAEVFCSHA